ncbi:hypothetical protein ACFRI7_31710 [Streptomyces sp. NPDC056716]|uniref:hypothetical protein n=1 Tax=unclassified Streptomyces TaxID=2593676 RepID=UPI0036AC4434
MHERTQIPSRSPALAPATLTLWERQFAVSQWLLGAAHDRKTVRGEWNGLGVALLACGDLFSAVRMPAHLVWAAVGTNELLQVDEALRRFFDGGAVFMDIHTNMYYALVPGTAASSWPWSDRDFPGVECLGRDTFLGVPAISRTKPVKRAYWCVPMDSPGDLTYVEEVVDLLRLGQEARDGGDVR